MTASETSSSTRHPEFDKDGYPTEATLSLIERWSYHDTWSELLDFCEEAWRNGCCWREDGVRKFATGGWSGNESIINAMARNRIFWATYWVMSRRGGYHEFRDPTEIPF